MEQFSRLQTTLSCQTLLTSLRLIDRRSTRPLQMESSGKEFTVHHTEHLNSTESDSLRGARWDCYESVQWGSQWSEFTQDKGSFRDAGLLVSSQSKI